VCVCVAVDNKRASDYREVIHKYIYIYIHMCVCACVCRVMCTSIRKHTANTCTYRHMAIWPLCTSCNTYRRLHRYSSYCNLIITSENITALFHFQGINLLYSRRQGGRGRNEVKVSCPRIRFPVNYLPTFSYPLPFTGANLCFYINPLTCSFKIFIL